MFVLLSGREKGVISAFKRFPLFFFFWFSMDNFFLDKMSERNCTGVLLEMDVP